MPLFNQLLMHDRDLPCRPTETNKSQLQPKSNGLPEADWLQRRRRQSLVRRVYQVSLGEFLQAFFTQFRADA